MEDIELVVKIPKEEYEMIVNSEDCGLHTLTRAIANGTPLKRHGRLIDADELKNDAQTMTEWNGDVFRCVTERTIDYAPTIIEADKGEE